jgi:aspartate racemase
LHLIAKVSSTIEAAVRIPLFHIADPTASKIREAGYSKVGLLGTLFTMEQGFYIDRLQKHHGLQVLVPKSEDREIVHRVIYEELCLGRILAKSRAEYRRVIADLKGQGAQGIILGCTEISRLVGPEDSEIPLFDTTRIHARSAAEWALAIE